MSDLSVTGSPSAIDVVPDRVRHIWLAIALLGYALLQLVYLTATPIQSMTLPDHLPPQYPSVAAAQTIPVGIGPDEKEHFLYILSLAERGAIPRPTPSYRTSPDQFVSYEAQQPPLFYGICAVLVRLIPAASHEGALARLWYPLRGLCTLFGVGVILLAARAAQIAFPDRPLVVVGTPFVVALTPMLGQMMGCLSNEPLAMLFTAWAWLQIARLIRSDTPLSLRDGTLLGLALGLACETRLTAVMWLPSAALTLIFAARRGKGGFAGIAAFCAVFAVLLAPWLLYNQMSYGTPFLRPFDRPLFAYGSFADFAGNGILPPHAPMLVTPRSTLLWYASTAWFPYWLVQFYLPGFPQAGPAWQSLCLLVDVAVLLLLFLHASRAQRERSPGVPDSRRVLLWAAGLAVVTCGIALLQQQFQSDWNVINSAGRYLVAAVPASALLFTFALSTAREKLGGATVTLKPSYGGAILLLVVMLLFDTAIALLVQRFYTDHPQQPALQNAPEPGR